LNKATTTNEVVFENIVLHYVWQIVTARSDLLIMQTSVWWPTLQSLTEAAYSARSTWSSPSNL